MRKRLLVTGGLQYDDAIDRPQGLRFKAARLIELNLESKEIKTRAEYVASGENYPLEGPNSIFLSAGLDGNRLYVCTSTEVLEYSYPDLEVLRVVSYPFFQNLHHVRVVGGRVAVVSTGLDLLVFLDRGTLEPVKFVNALGKDPWHKYSPDIDYRKYVSLKPHDSHPNHVFQIDGALWLTRFIQRDAICIDDFKRTINIGLESPHDGLVYEGGVYFTTVDGHIVRANATSFEIEDVVDLNMLEGSSGALGWCRGLLVEDGIAYVGFTRLRATKIKENVRWALRLVGSSQPRDTRVAAYNLKKRTKVAEVTFPHDSISAIYSVLAP